MTVTRGKWVMQRFRDAVDEVIVRLRAAGLGIAGRKRAGRSGRGRTRAPSRKGGSAGSMDVDMGAAEATVENVTCGDIMTPGLAAGVSRSTSMFLTTALEAQMRDTFGFTACVHMDEQRVPVVRRTHSQRMWGAMMGA